jgi:hypothetical protein
LFIFSTSKQPSKSKLSLFIINDSNQQRHPYHQRRLTNHSSRPTTTEKTTTSAHRSKLIYYLRHRSTAPPQQTFGFSIQTSVTNSQPQPHTNPPQPAPTGDSCQQGQHNRSLSSTIHSVLAFNSDNGSTGPRPAATSQTPQPFPRTADPSRITDPLLLRRRH